MLRLLTTPVGRILVSILWGLGLASLFRRSCNGSRCIIIQGPPMEEVVDRTFQYQGDEQCYQFQPYTIACPGSPRPQSDFKTPV